MLEAQNSDDVQLCVSAVSVQEYLEHPAGLAEEDYHRAREVLAPFAVLTFDRAAAEAAAKLVSASRTQDYIAAGALTRSQAKAWWKRDAAILGTAISHKAERVYTFDGPMRNYHVPGVSVLSP
jgi:predicted nucleic acid-binding protein